MFYLKDAIAVSPLCETNEVDANCMSKEDGRSYAAVFCKALSALSDLANLAGK